MSNSEIFAQYVTRTAFSLNLSRPMLTVLHQIWRNERLPPEYRHYDRAGVIDNWVTAAHSLVRRGLAYHVGNPDRLKVQPDFHLYWRLTEAGTLTHRLCQIAQLLPEEKFDADVPSVSGLPRKRKSA